MFDIDKIHSKAQILGFEKFDTYFDTFPATIYKQEGKTIIIVIAQTYSDAYNLFVRTAEEMTELVSCNKHIVSECEFDYGKHYSVQNDETYSSIYALNLSTFVHIISNNSAQINEIKETICDIGLPT